MEKLLRDLKGSRVIVRGEQTCYWTGTLVDVAKDSVHLKEARLLRRVNLADFEDDTIPFIMISKVCEAMDGSDESITLWRTLSHFV